MKPLYLLHQPWQMTSNSFKISLRVVDFLQIPVEEVKEHKLLDILHTPSLTRIALPINETLLDPAKTLWQTSAIITPTFKRPDKNYYVPSKDLDVLFSHPSTNSLVVNAMWQRAPR